MDSPDHATGDHRKSEEGPRVLRGQGRMIVGEEEGATFRHGWQEKRGV